MQTIILSDHDATSNAARQVLLQHGLECPPANQIALGHGADFLALVKPGLVLVVLSPDPEKALAVLGGIHPLTQARILVVGAAGDSRLVLRALRAGAADYVDEA